MPAPPPESEPAMVRAMFSWGRGIVGNLHSLLRDLQRRKARERRGLVVAEGRRLVADALAAGAHGARGARGRRRRGGRRRARSSPTPGRAASRSRCASARTFQELADTDSPSGVLAVVEWAPRGARGGPPAGGAGAGAGARRRAGPRQRRHDDPHRLRARRRPHRGARRQRRPPQRQDAAARRWAPSSATPSPRPTPRSASTSSRRSRWCSGRPRWTGSRVARPGPPRCRAARSRWPSATRAAASGPSCWRARRAASSVPMRPGAESLNAAVAAGILLHQVLDAR